jgi:cytoskeletal protein RodZ
MNDILESIIVSEQTPGQLLKTAREARQIGIGEVAQRLLLSKSIIIAIEEDDYSRISASVYAEGYLKAYAQFLQIPADALLISFRHLNVYSKAEVVTETKAQLQQNRACRCRCREFSDLLKGQCRGRVILGAVILVLAILVIFIGKQYFGKSLEVIHVPNSLTNTINKEEVIHAPDNLTDSKIPIITTTADANNVVMSDTKAEAASKKKHAFKKADKSDVQDVPLMLDTNLAIGKSSGDKEPNLILTKPQS